LPPLLLLPLLLLLLAACPHSPTRPTRSPFFTSQVQSLSTCWFLNVIDTCTWCKQIKGKKEELAFPFGSRTNHRSVIAFPSSNKEKRAKRNDQRGCNMEGHQEY
jgi:hypothetical protein